jgi:predicted NAD/FAD-binding protein
MRVAIVGTGISGLTCAHLLHPHHEVTMFEASSRIGGHAHTVGIEVDGQAHRVDTGFIVFNQRNYPNFTRLLARLGVGSHESDMSFSVSRPDGSLEWRGMSLNRLFSQRSNLLRPSFHRLLSDIFRFHRRAARLLEETGTEDWSMAELVAAGRYGPGLVEQYLVPVGSAIWSADPSRFLEDFPALSFARFFQNHGLLGLRDRPRWKTVTGGSARYVEALVAPFGHRVHRSTPVEKVRGLGSGEVELYSPSTGPLTFDRVVLATHSDQALRLLADAGDSEYDILSAIRYQPNVATLHTDRRLLPHRPRAWASWNYHLLEHQDGRAKLTYHMNQLQGLRSTRPICVTLNRHDDIDPGQIHGRFEYDHPVLDARAVRAQARGSEIQGRRGIYYAGAYWGYGFHEDGVDSALEVAARLGARW